MRQKEEELKYQLCDTPSPMLCDVDSPKQASTTMAEPPKKMISIVKYLNNQGERKECLEHEAKECLEHEEREKKEHEEKVQCQLDRERLEFYEVEVARLRFEQEQLQKEQEHLLSEQEATTKLLKQQTP